MRRINRKGENKGVRKKMSTRDECELNKTGNERRNQRKKRRKKRQTRKLERERKRK